MSKKRLIIPLMIVPTITLGTALITTITVSNKENFHLNNILNEEVIKQNITKTFDGFKNNGKDIKNSIYWNVENAIKKSYGDLFKNIKTDLNLQFYYGSKEDFDSKIINLQANDNELILYFTCEIRSNDDKYFGVKTIEFDYRPRISELPQLYFNSKFGRDTEQVMKGFNDVLKSIAMQESIAEWYRKKGFIFEEFDHKIFSLSNEEIKTMINTADYFRQRDYDEKDKTIKFRQSFINWLSINKKSSFIYFDQEITMPLYSPDILKSKWLKETMGKELSEFENFNSDSVIEDIIECISERILNNIYKKLSLIKPNNIKSKMVLKVGWESKYEPLKPNLTLQQVVEFNKIKSGKIYLWIEIWSINDTRLRINNEVYKDGPGFSTYIGVVKNEN